MMTMNRAGIQFFDHYQYKWQFVEDLLCAFVTFIELVLIYVVPRALRQNR